jgi:hypothetical protein
MSSMPTPPTAKAPARTELSKYTAASIMEIARSLQVDMRDRILREQQLQMRLAQFKFRDDYGYYWTVEPQSLAWYVYNQGRWTLANPPQGTLEGLAHQALTPIPLRKSTMNENDQAPTSGDTIGDFAAGIRTIREAYQLGQITSVAAEGLASLTYMVDKSARLWTVGLQSGAWYYFDGGRWNRSGQPLDASQLSDQSYNSEKQLVGNEQQAFEQAKAKIVDLAKSGVVIPEQVSAPFNPPPDFPAQPAPTVQPAPAYAPSTVPMTAPMPQSVIGACPRCGRGVAPGARFCGNCGYDMGGTKRV